jgi:hypothetical protein
MIIFKTALPVSCSTAAVILTDHSGKVGWSEKRNVCTSQNLRYFHFSIIVLLETACR